METVEHALASGWTLLAHPAYKLYFNENSYIVLDEDKSVILNFTINDIEIEFLESAWSTEFKININKRMITIINEPEIFDEEDEE